MHIAYLSIFPDLFQSFFATSLIQKAIARSLFSVETVNIRDFAEPPHFKVDDVPYGGGPGMVMKVEPLTKAIEATKALSPKARTILLAASGKPFSQEDASRLAQYSELIFVCGRYEGVDQRVVDLCIDEELSIGPYVTMGGELPAMVLTEAIVRLLPGVLGNSESPQNDSFISGSDTIEAPQYTRPEEFREQHVPAILLSGNHQAIDQWRKKTGAERARKRKTV